MTLDDETYISQREAMRRQEEADAARRFADYQEQRLLESVECEEAKWQGIFGRMRWERPTVFYEDGPDRRLHDWRAAIADGLEPDDQRDGAA